METVAVDSSATVLNPVYFQISSMTTTSGIASSSSKESTTAAPIDLFWFRNATTFTCTTMNITSTKFVFLEGSGIESHCRKSYRSKTLFWIIFKWNFPEINFIVGQVKLVLYHRIYFYFEIQMIILREKLFFHFFVMSSMNSAHFNLATDLTSQTI